LHAHSHKATQNPSGAGDVEDVVVMPSPQEDGSGQCLATSETRISQFEQMARGCQVFNQLVQQIRKPCTPVALVSLLHPFATK